MCYNTRMNTELDNIKKHPAISRIITTTYEDRVATGWFTSTFYQVHIRDGWTGLDSAIFRSKSIREIEQMLSQLKEVAK